MIDVPDAGPYWTPVDLLMHQDCDHHLTTRLARRSGLWVDPVEDLAGAWGHDVTSLLRSHASMVLSKITRDLAGGRGTPSALAASPIDLATFARAVDATSMAMAAEEPVVAGAAFEAGRFRGVADLMIRSEDGWVLADSRLSAIAPGHAAVTLAALGSELERVGHEVAPYVALVGSGGEQRRWRRRRLDAILDRRRRHVEDVLAGVGLAGDRPSAHDPDRTARRGRRCEVCADSGDGEAPDVAEQLRTAGQPAVTRFPAARPGDMFLHVERLQPELGSGQAHVLVVSCLSPPGSSEPQCKVWWGQDRSQQVNHALELLDDIRRALAHDKTMHVFHRGTGAVRHLLRTTAVEPEAGHVLASLLGGRSGRVLIDLDDAAIDLGAAPGRGVDPALAAAAFVAQRLGDGPAAASLREQVVASAKAACLETLELRARVLEKAQAASGAGVVVPPFEDTATHELARTLRERGGAPHDRSAEEEVCALLASALGYFERERAEFVGREQRWMHHPPSVWSDDPDVLAFVEPPVVVREPSVLPGHRTLTRGLEAWSPDHGNSRVRPGPMRAVGRRRGQPGVTRPVNAELGACTLRDVERDGEGLLRVSFDQPVDEWEPRALQPIALVPRQPPDDFYQFRAVHDLASLVQATDVLPRSAMVDVLARRPPRLTSGLAMPRSANPSTDLLTALQDLDDSFVAVQGPPGTGKTRLGATVVRRLVHDGWKVGVVAQSHAAVEHFLQTAIKHGLDPELAVKSPRKGVRPSGGWKAVKDIPSYVRASTEGLLVGGTVWTFSNPMLAARSLDLLVVEEAGQLSLAQTMAAARASRNLLLLGDPQQLPGVSEGVHDEPVDASPLDWLTQGSSVLPGAFGYFLPESYRMGPALCARVSALSYDGRLRSHEAATLRRLKAIDPGVLRVEVEHADNGAASPEEADEVVRRIKALLGAKWSDPARYDYAVGLKEGDFLVVAAFNAQVNLIRDRLAAAGLSHVRVGTVDRFQGQEAPVVLLSMASSRLDLTPRSADFLLDPRRLNVAISRAQWLAVIVCSEGLAGTIPQDAGDLEAVAAFVGLADRVERAT